MDAFVIQGGTQLNGEIQISGSKNASLPLMAAALLTNEKVIIQDIPDLRDIRNMRGLLEELGCSIESNREDENSLTSFQVDDESDSHARYEIVRTMRASICVLGPLLAKRGIARVSMPGGCAIGERPVDLHLRGMRALGAEVHLDAGDIIVKAGRLKGTTIFLGGPFGSTVLGTANVMSAATLAEGTTVIECAACEPEIVELSRLLIGMGANITGAGTPRITIQGVEELHGTTHRVMPDRIEAGTYFVAAAITRGDLTVKNCPIDCLLSLEDRMQSAGVSFDVIEGTRIDQRATVRVASIQGQSIRPAQMTTQPYPGYPTDLQAQLMAMLTIADGISVITEKIYPERFLHVAELSRMGAQIYRQGPTAVIQGVPNLIGAPVMASDLRASAGLVLAGMAAKGETILNRVYHLDRGYEHMERKLNAVGASIERVDDAEL